MSSYKASSFLAVLHDLAGNEKVDLVNFGYNGDSLVISNVAKFEDEVLPANFATTRFASFIRSLSYYGSFRRERADLLETIKRKGTGRRKVEDATVVDTSKSATTGPVATREYPVSPKRRSRKQASQGTLEELSSALFPIARNRTRMTKRMRSSQRIASKPTSSTQQHLDRTTKPQVGSAGMPLIQSTTTHVTTGVLDTQHQDVRPRSSVENERVGATKARVESSEEIEPASQPWQCDFVRQVYSPRPMNITEAMLSSLKLYRSLQTKQSRVPRTGSSWGPLSRDARLRRPQREPHVRHQGLNASRYLHGHLPDVLSRGLTLGVPQWRQPGDCPSMEGSIPPPPPVQTGILSIRELSSDFEGANTAANHEDISEDAARTLASLGSSSPGTGSRRRIKDHESSVGDDGELEGSDASFLAYSEGLFPPTSWSTGSGRFSTASCQHEGMAAPTLSGYGNLRSQAGETTQYRLGEDMATGKSSQQHPIENIALLKAAKGAPYLASGGSKLNRTAESVSDLQCPDQDGCFEKGCTSDYAQVNHALEGLWPTEHPWDAPRGAATEPASLRRVRFTAMLPGCRNGKMLEEHGSTRPASGRTKPSIAHLTSNGLPAEGLCDPHMQQESSPQGRFRLSASRLYMQHSEKAGSDRPKLYAAWPLRRSGAVDVEAGTPDLHPPSNSRYWRQAQCRSSEAPHVSTQVGPSAYVDYELDPYGHAYIQPGVSSIGGFASSSSGSRVALDSRLQSTSCKMYGVYDVSRDSRNSYQGVSPDQQSHQSLKVAEPLMANTDSSTMPSYNGNQHGEQPRSDVPFAATLPNNLDPRFSAHSTGAGMGLPESTGDLIGRLHAAATNPQSYVADIGVSYLDVLPKPRASNSMQAVMEQATQASSIQELAAALRRALGKGVASALSRHLVSEGYDGSFSRDEPTT